MVSLCIKIFLSVCLQPHRQHHIDEILLPLGGQDDTGGHAGGELQAQAVCWGGLQCVHQVLVVEADLQPLAVPRDGALVGGIPDARLGGDGRHSAGGSSVCH